MNNLKALLRPIVHRLRGKQVVPQGEAGIQILGHRAYVGGKWDAMGKLQFDFLVAQGLQPQHYLLDVACGSLRAGRHFIPYLEAGHYLGIDKEDDLIQAGINEEIGPVLNAEKQPVFVISDAFEFEKFSVKPDYALAQSLFTHLPPPLINMCFANLRPAMQEDGKFYATFFEVGRAIKNPSISNDFEPFSYTREQIEAFGADHGWGMNYIGDWQHPKGQIIVQYYPA